MKKLVVAGLWMAALFGSARACSSFEEKYRSIDGRCNNLLVDRLGTANTTYARAIAAEYGDCSYTPRRAQSGQELPNARFLSTTLFGGVESLDPDFTLLNMQFGQLVSHDMALTGGVFDALPCCANGQLAANPAARCFAISIPSNDPKFAGSGTQCLNLIRTATTRDWQSGPGSSNRPTEQINSATSFLDLSVVYGVNKDDENMLRAFTGGLMKVVNRNGGSWPPDAPNPGTACSFAKPGTHCYITGDRRANHTPHLAILHIAFLREHNRIAAELQRLHPSWSDSELFTVARSINIAQYQYIVYYEYLPNILGTNAMAASGLIFPSATGYVSDYDSSIDPTVLNEHSTVAMRYFHTEIVGLFQLLDTSRNLVNTTRLSDNMDNPVLLEQSNGYDCLTRGMSTQPMSAINDKFDPEMQHSMFRRNSELGTDLRALDIQRARDHGIAGYNKVREYCGLPRATQWAHFSDLMDPADISRLRSVYQTVDDVEYTVAALLEYKYLDSKVGRTFHCILTKQWQRTRRGDRFYFENDVATNRLTVPQLQSIRKASIARVLCDTTPNTPMMQRKAFQQVTPSNPLQYCSSLPAVDLSLW